MPRAFKSPRPDHWAISLEDKHSAYIRKTAGSSPASPTIWGRSIIGNAPHRQCEDYEFNSRRLHQFDRHHHKIRMFLETKHRTTFKAITWRVCAVVNSYVALQMFPDHGNLYKALIMNATGFFVFYFFERLWNRIQWGKIKIQTTP